MPLLKRKSLKFKGGWEIVIDFQSGTVQTYGVQDNSMSGYEGSGGGGAAPCSTTVATCYNSSRGTRCGTWQLVRDGGDTIPACCVTYPKEWCY